MAVFCDIGTYLLLQRQKAKVNGADLIPWNVGNKQVYSTTKVPIYATFIAGLTLGLQGVFIPISAHFFHQKNTIWGNVLFAAFCNCIYTPVILIFTAKNKKDKLAPILPPTTLQGLEEDEEERSDEIPEEINRKINLDIETGTVSYKVFNNA